MKHWLRSVIDIRKGEMLITGLMIFYIYLILVTYYLLKPARDSLFLTKLGAEQLPLVFILIALVVVPITTLYSRASAFLKLSKLINLTTIIIIVNLLILRWMLTLEAQEWVYYVFYIWVSIYGALTTSQFWLMANAVYDSSQAKRVFVIFSLAAIIGAFSGGSITRIIINSFGISTEDLLFFCMAFLGITILLATGVWSINRREVPRVPAQIGYRKKKQKTENWAEMFRDIKKYRHLRLIMGIIAMTMATASFVDYQFKFVSVNAFTDPITGVTNKEALTAFLGTFYGGLSLIGFLFQFLFSYRTLKIFGVGGVILFLPISLAIASVGMLIHPGLVTGVLLRGSDGTFKYSIDKTARELLFLPIPLAVKKRSKMFIDLFIDRIFRGISGGVLLMFTVFWHFTQRQISIAVLVMLGIWIFMDLLIRKEYVNAFRLALDKGQIDPNQLTIKVEDAETVGYLIQALASDNERQVTYALDLLQDTRDKKVLSAVHPLLHHSNPVIRLKVVKILINQQNGKFADNALEFLNDENPEIRIEAMHYICSHGENGYSETLARYLNSVDIKYQHAALGCLAQYGQPEQAELLSEQLVHQILARSDPEGQPGRIFLARAIGRFPDSRFQPYLLQLLADNSPGVVKEAIVSAGKTKDREYVPFLLKLLKEKPYRGNARRALATYGNSVLGTLMDHLNDPAADFSLRINIPRVFSQVPTQEAADMLITNLSRHDNVLKYAMIRALYHLRQQNEELKFSTISISKIIIEEIRQYYELFAVYEVFCSDNEISGSISLLTRSLQEKLSLLNEQIFLLLTLIHSPQDIRNAHRGIISNDKLLRANAIEFLENTLSKDIRKHLMPVLEQLAPREVLRKGHQLFAISIDTAEEGFRTLINGKDVWLKACAIYTIPNPRDNAWIELIREAEQAENSLVRETARFKLTTA